MPVKPFTDDFSRTSSTWEHIRAFKFFGGAEEDRTPDLRIANATLSQLSYRPNLSGR